MEQYLKYKFIPSLYIISPNYNIYEICVRSNVYWRVAWAIFAEDESHKSKLHPNLLGSNFCGSREQKLPFFFFAEN
jgi:hypothetical protein